MKKKVLTILVLFAIAFATTAAAAPATVIVSNLGKSIGTAYEAGGGTWIAQSFTTNAVSYDLTSVICKFQSGSSGATLRLFSSSGGNIGSVLCTFGSAALISGSDYRFTPSFSVTLAASTTYWIALQGPGSPSVWWYTTTDETNTGPGTITPIKNGDCLSGGLCTESGNWTYYYTEPYMFAVEGTAAASSTLSASALTGFGNVCTNTTAGPNSFTITGTALSTANVTVGALSGFTYCTTSGGTYASSLSLTQPGGTYSQAIYVKFSPTAVQSYNGNIPVGGGGATSINVAAAGSGVYCAPTTQAYNITFTSVQETQMTIGWTNGNGSKRAVFVKEGTGAITNPSDNTTYTASASWTSKGTQLGSSGYYCVYNDISNSVTLTGLTGGTQYTVQVFEYNGTSGLQKYYTATATDNPKSQSTAAAAQKTIFWTDYNTGKIQKRNLVTNITSDVVTGLVGPRGVAVDQAAGKIYWVEYGQHLSIDASQKICRANFDGTNIEVLKSI